MSNLTSMVLAHGGFVEGSPFLGLGKFPAFFAAEVRPSLASFTANSQDPWGLEASQRR
jgi:hypothetical protein